MIFGFSIKNCLRISYYIFDLETRTRKTLQAIVINPGGTSISLRIVLLYKLINPRRKHIFVFICIIIILLLYALFLQDVCGHGSSQLPILCISKQYISPYYVLQFLYCHPFTQAC